MLTSMLNSLSTAGYAADNQTFNITSTNTNFPEELVGSFWNKFIENTSYLFYSIIFMIGITGNSIVIYVLMSSLCLKNSANRANYAYSVAQPTTYQPNVSPTLKRALTGGSFKTRQENPASIRIKTNHNESTPELRKFDKKYSIGNETTNTNADGTMYEPYRKSIVNNYNNNNFTTQIIQSSPPLQIKSFSESKFKQIRLFVIKILKEKLRVTNFYLLNLAITDFLYLASIPFLVCTIRFKSWKFGYFFCKFYWSLCYLCQCSSVFILVVLSVDRYLSVKYPRRTHTFRSNELTRIVMLISWTLSILFITPVIRYSQLHNNANESLDCRIDWPETWNFSKNTNTSNFFNDYLSPLHAFNIYTLLLNYLIPVGIIVILYTEILRRLHRRTKSDLKTSKSKTKKITRMVLMIIICYLICWTPYWFSQIFNYIYHLIFKKESSIILILISHFVQIIAYMSSALNPFIYSYMSEGFRTDFKLALANSCCCSSLFQTNSNQNEMNNLELKRKSSIKKASTKQEATSINILEKRKISKDKKNKITKLAESFRKDEKNEPKFDDTNCMIYNDIPLNSKKCNKLSISSSIDFDPNLNSIDLINSNGSTNHNNINKKNDRESLKFFMNKKSIKSIEKKIIKRRHFSSDNDTSTEMSDNDGNATYLTNRKSLVSFCKEPTPTPPSPVIASVTEPSSSSPETQTQQQQQQTTNEKTKKNCVQKKSTQNDSIKTFIYKPKSNFAFAINFHSFNAKNSIVRNKLSILNNQILNSSKQAEKQKNNERCLISTDHTDQQPDTTTTTTTSKSHFRRNRVKMLENDKKNVNKLDDAEKFLIKKNEADNNITNLI